MKLIVLSDLHITADPGDLPEGRNLIRLETAIERINSAYSDADLVVFAGDLADRGARTAPYEALKTALATLKVPYALTLGNHDSRETFTGVFGQAHSDEHGFIQSAQSLAGTHVILLDSASDIPAPAGFRGACDPQGQLCARRLDWLEARLGDATGQPVIVILHHPPLALHISNDGAALQDPGAFLDLCSAHGGVRQVISGHIHMTSTAFYRGMAFTTLAGNCTTVSEDIGRKQNKIRREGPAQMAVVLSDADQTTVHFDTYVDAHTVVPKR